MQNIIIGIVVVAAVAVGGFFLANNYIYNEKQAGDSQDLMVGESGNMKQADEGAFTGSFFDLVSRGGNFRCEIQHDSVVAFSKGVVFVSGNNIRGDFTSETQGFTVESHLIHKDGYLYAWSPLSPQGFKAKSVLDEKTDSSVGTSGSYADATQAYDYNCEKWEPDMSVFDVPSNITFVETN